MGTQFTASQIRCSDINPRHKGRVDKEIIVETGLIYPIGKITVDQIPLFF